MVTPLDFVGQFRIRCFLGLVKFAFGSDRDKVYMLSINRMQTAEEKRTLDRLQNDLIRRAVSCESKAPKCDQVSPYRTANGTCNNLINTLRGAANTAFRRFRSAPPAYGDGVSTPREAKYGKPLPNARLVSYTAFDNRDRPSTTQTHMSMIWGQFLAHDFLNAASQKVDCTGKCDGLEGECYGIKIPKNDPHFPSVNVDCITLTRRAPAVPAECGLGPRQQLNTLSAFIDGSQIYGESDDIIARERDLSSDLGLMKERPNPNGVQFKSLLPANSKLGACRTTDPVKMPCFRAGDARVNENQGKDYMGLCASLHEDIYDTITRFFSLQISHSTSFTIYIHN